MMVNSYYFLMADEQTILDTFASVAPDYLKEDYKGKALNYYYAFDLSCSSEIQTQIASDLAALIGGDSNRTGYVEAAATNLADVYALYGGILFIGIFIGTLFIMATVLIIYYKQISEGYEDKARYAIMQKVGMSLKEVRQSIKSQVLTIFFLPLCVSCIHLAFAFPLMRTVLKAMNLTDAVLYAFASIGTVIVFSLFYTIVLWTDSKNLIIKLSAKNNFKKVQPFFTAALFYLHIIINPTNITMPTRDIIIMPIRPAFFILISKTKRQATMIIAAVYNIQNLS